MSERVWITVQLLPMPEGCPWRWHAFGFEDGAVRTRVAHLLALQHEVDDNDQVCDSRVVALELTDDGADAVIDEQPGHLASGPEFSTAAARGRGVLAELQEADAAAKAGT